MSKKGSAMMNKKIYIACVLSILYASIYRFRLYFTRRYTPLINEASITITKSKPNAEYDDGEKHTLSKKLIQLKLKMMKKK